MSRYCQLVIGPAGSGKSTYCDLIQKHGEVLRRNIQVVNLDPAAEQFNYNLLADIRDLISIDDVMECEDLNLGPNGGLMYCMDYLTDNLEWLREVLEEDVEDDYILFDCPGQVELYTHSQVMVKLVEELKRLNFKICSVFILDSQFLVDTFKYISGMMCALSSMISIEVSSVNVISKLDLLDKKSRKELDRILNSDAEEFLKNNSDLSIVGTKFKKLTNAIATVIDNYAMVRFMPLDITNEETIEDLLSCIDANLQYGEDAEPRENRAEEYSNDLEEINDRYFQ